MNVVQGSIDLVDGIRAMAEADQESGSPSRVNGKAGERFGRRGLRCTDGE